MNGNTLDKHSPEYQQSLIRSARYNLLVAILFTALNIVMLLVGSNRYFLFSTSVPYYLTYFGYVFDHYIVGTYTLTGLTVSAVFLAAYVVCWLLSARNRGWFVAALVLFGVDTLAMVALMLLFGDIGGWLLDIVFHVWVIISLSRGIAAAKRLQNMPAGPEPVPYSPDPEPEEEQI